MQLICLSLHHISLPYKEFQKYRFKNPSEFYEKTKRIEERVLMQSGTRIEVYAVVKNQEFDFLTKFFPREINIYKGKKVAEHLFRLVGAIESRVLGENHLHLIAEEAYKLAEENLATKKCLKALFGAAKKVSKRVREETSMTDVNNVVEVAIKALSEQLESLEGKKVLLFGGGLSGIALARALKEEKAEVSVTTRNSGIARIISQEIGANIVEYSRVKEAISRSDILICATLASHYRVKPEMIKLKNKLIIIDLSPFRNVDPNVKKIENVILINSKVDKAVRKSMNSMKKEIPKVEKIIEEEIKNLEVGKQCPL